MIGNIIYDMIVINKHDTKRINHALKVYGFAKCIAEKENISKQDLLTLQIAAVLHDIGIAYCESTFGKCTGKMQELHGPGIAEEILNKYDLPDEAKKRVLFLIAHHHTYDNIDGIDYRILIEADLLVNYDEKDFGRDAFLTVYDRLFKTAAGRQIAKQMFDI